MVRICYVFLHLLSSTCSEKALSYYEKTLKNADPFEEVFKKMIKWIKNIVHRANNFRNPENMPKKYFPGIIEYKVVI